MSESQGYADAPRDSVDPNQVTCRTCGATVHVGVRDKHDAWHEQVVTDDELAKVVDQITQRGQYNP